MSLTSKRAIELYGDPGYSDKPNPTWVKDNIVYCGGDGRAQLPAMPGVPPRYWFAVHRKAEPAMRRAFTAAHAACPSYVIETAGCFVYRHQRWDTVEKADAEDRAILPLSNHSWGAAVDINAKKNGAREYRPGRCPPPFSEAWEKVWPDGLPEAFVKAFENEGFTWGGRWTSYCDPMHMELGSP